MIRGVWVGLVALVATLRYGIPILVASRSGRRPGGRRPQRMAGLCRENPRRWARRIVRAAGVSVELEGTEHLRAGEPAVLVANHQSWFDVLTLTGHLHVDYRFVAKKELEGIPVFGPAWMACGHVSIDRRNLTDAIQSLERTREIVRDARPTVIMFPEGTRSPTGELAPFKKGAFVLAIQTGVPVVPAAIVGTREVMPKGSWRIRAGTVRIRIGAPIPVEGLSMDDRDALTRTAHRAVARIKDGAPLAGPWDWIGPPEGAAS